MIKPKIVISSGAAGFVLSFLISIISTHSFGHSLLRGLIFGLVFAALSVGIEFLNSKFLGGDDAGNPMAEGSGSENGTLGSRVDITLSDDNLTDDGDKLNFMVSQNRQSMSPEEIKPPVQQNVIEDAGPGMEKVPAASVTSSAAVPQSQEKASFTPVSLGGEVLSSTGDSKESSVVKADSTAATGTPEAVSSKRAQARAEREADIKEVGELPDIGSFAPENRSESDDDLIVDSDFASGGVDEGVAFSSPSPASAAAVDPHEHDATTMAKAIRTLLKKED